MRGVIGTALLMITCIQASAGAVLAGEAEEARDGYPDTEKFPSKHTTAPNHELMLKKARQAQEKRLFQRQMRQLEKLLQQARRDADRAKKLQQLKRSANSPD
ncbi:hypothetical protein [Microbulbifer spongiae]|uniref:Uncharacterized protein n=1 Tax=Microbulbifer spongiae TaxID=2944933 RepID=A0ABY9EBS6_9GAMM|nr:hypothetical protein [Microbulbifer sp. MI-G]WKD49915.1 hypothetical protein M8T91_00350 [Microbulbifer sp. MI-G]